MVSIGIAALDATKAKAPGALVDLTDQVLYHDKESGRNRVIEYSNVMVTAQG